MPVLRGDTALERFATAGAAALAVGSLVFRAMSTFVRAYGNDDFFWAYTAWLRSTSLVPRRDYYVANFTPLSELAAPLFRAFPQSFAPFFIARIVMLLAGVALLALVYLLTRRLGGSPLWALVAVNVVTWQPQFVAHIVDIRADQIGAAFLLGAIVMILERRPLVAGLLYGLAVATTYKLAVAAPFVLFGLLLATRRWRALLAFAGAAAIAPLAYFASRVAIDGWAVVRAIAGEIAGAVGSGVSDRASAFVTAARSAPIVVLLLGIALLLAVRRKGELRVYMALTASFFATYIWLNPFIFPYNFVILVPLVAPVVVGLDGPNVGRHAVACALVIAAIVGGLPMALVSVNVTKEPQEAVIRWMWATTTPSTAAFDWQGAHVGRPGVVHWWMYTGLLPKYRNGWFSVAEELDRAQVRLVLLNYRIDWLSPRDAQFLHEHFLAVDRCLLAPGWKVPADALRRGVTIDAFLRDGSYAMWPFVPGILLDGQPMTPRQTISRGRHVVSIVPGTPTPPVVAWTALTPQQLQAPPPCRSDTLLEWRF